jgi:hypothetical protein
LPLRPHPAELYQKAASLEATLTITKGYSDNFGLGDGEVDFDNFDDIRRGVAYLIETVKNFAAPPPSSQVIPKGGETGGYSDNCRFRPCPPKATLTMSEGLL